MSKFLKLTKYLLNTNDIHKIVILPNKYNIHIASKEIDGFITGFGGANFGYISSHTSEIEVCETKHPTDFKIVSDWISKL